MFVYMTRPGDTYAKVAQLFYDKSDDSACQILRQVNYNRHATRMMGQAASLMPFLPFVIPGYGAEISQLTAQQMLLGIEFLDASARQKITMAMRQGFNMQHAIAVGRVLNAHNQLGAMQESSDTEPSISFVGAGMREVGGRLAERVGQPAEAFSSKMEVLQQSAIHYKNVLKSTHDVTSRQVARDLYKTAHQEALESLNKSSHFYSQSRANRIKHAIRGKNRLMRQMTSKGFVLEDVEDFKAVESIGKWSGVGGSAFLAIGIGLGVAEVYETAEAGGDWFAKLAGVTRLSSF